MSLSGVIFTHIRWIKSAVLCQQMLIVTWIFANEVGQGLGESTA